MMIMGVEIKSIGLVSNLRGEELISRRCHMDMSDFWDAKAKRETTEKATAKQPVNIAEPEAMTVIM